MKVEIKYQSPYKGFNRFSKEELEIKPEASINPPIRGSIDARHGSIVLYDGYGINPL